MPRTEEFEKAIETREVRRARQAIEGAQPMSEYTRKTHSVLDQMSKLKAERLRRDALSKDK